MKGTDRKNLIHYLDISQKIAPNNTSKAQALFEKEKPVNQTTNTTAPEDPKTKNYIKFTTLPQFTPLVSEWIGDFNAIHNVGTKFYFQTNLNAPNSKLIMIDLNDPTKQIDVLPERKDQVLQTSAVQNNKLLVKYMVNASDSFQIYDLGLNHP